MNEITELQLKRYVMATLDNPTQYLISEHFGKWSFTDNIQLATKTTNKSIAKNMRDFFYNDTGLNYVDIVIVPIKIEYKLIEETE